ncbi:dihydroorotate dehydrogenase electron transfer subunit [Ammoniphilus oxalaticus]|uniref:Dihydroorotate dehydrogenase B (NAD(+)), electron transfer subunit n=1 Tax=Ammoniphilus oxalaticus TaxID=66863 RepID=A0A419SJD3_9BACL|nr:dihydroorotate dehydrogenase electron transfer subunit [Ammoniphilus oxalaticus]RKD24123.1 dihydroorotate dehydrogenase electron transfer subunit [Ammoniphilus oxalaticus]
MDKGLLQVVSNELVADRVYRIRLQGEWVNRKIVPGQFLHVKCGPGIDPLLRRPISISDVDQTEHTLDMIYRVEGSGTKILSEAIAGNQIDLLGPLGIGFPIDQRQKGERALLIGGGVGVPPLLYLARELAQKGVRVTSVIGFGEANQVFLEEELGSYGEVYVTTIDGSKGHNGLVTDLLNEQYGLDNNAWDVLYACGPLPMLRALQDRYQATDKEAYLSLEQRMGCGVGACLACVYPAAEGSDHSYYKTCSDGPVFELRKVVLG